MQEGKLADMKKMLQILEGLGLTKNTYFMQQVSVWRCVGSQHLQCALVRIAEPIRSDLSAGICCQCHTLGT